MQFGIIGSGSWATALAKMLTDNNHSIHWWMRTAHSFDSLAGSGFNPNYLSQVKFKKESLILSRDINQVATACDVLVFAMPSAFAESSVELLGENALNAKKVVSAIKGLVPGKNILLNELLAQRFGFLLSDYFAVLGPCHAEEVAEEKLSYLTFSGINTGKASEIAAHFSTPYINTIVNHDILGVQYAAVLKNIYALGAGIAHGLNYGDNFLSVYIANAADEMAGFLRHAGAEHITVGEHYGEDPVTHRKSPNYAASVYLGDLLVTCYSLHSRNRSFGKMIGAGKSVDDIRSEMNMVAEGFNAARCIFLMNSTVKASIPIAETIYRILWEQIDPAKGFRDIEDVLI